MRPWQAAFEDLEEARDDAKEAGCEESEAQASPGARALQRAKLLRQRAELDGLRRLLGGEEVNCVLCKEPLCAYDESGELPPVGLISRACRQRLPQTSQARHRDVTCTRVFRACTRLFREAGARP